MPIESDSEHDVDETAAEPDRLGPSDERSDESARTGDARAPHTPADASDRLESLRDIHFTRNERGPAGESARSPDDDWLRSLDGEEARPTTEHEAVHKVNTWRLRFDDEPERALNDLQAKIKELGYELAYAGRTFRAPVTERTYYIIDTDKREAIDAFRDGEVDLTLLDACLWSELAFKKWRRSLLAESDGLTRAAEPAGDAGAAGLAGAERGRRGAWMLAGLAALAILVAATASAVVVSRSDGSRPAGKVVSDHTTAPTATTAPVATTAPAPETSVSASPVPPPAPTAPRTTTTLRRAPPANPGPAVTASGEAPPANPGPAVTAPPPDTTPPPPDTTPPPPDTTPPPPDTTPEPPPST
jgi:hypothetical protein